MKAHHFLPPVLALIGGALWTGYQHRSISTLEHESGVLQSYIESVRNTPPGAGNSTDPATRTKPDGKSQLVAKKVDWKKLIELQKSGDDVSRMRSAMEAQRALLEMSTNDLLAELDSIQAMDLTDDDKRNLAGNVIGILAQRDPEMVLNRFIEDLRNDRMTWQLSDAFTRWSSLDSAAAGKWIDSQIDAGTFDSKALDGRSSQRNMFEAGLAASLLKTDPAAAEARINALTPEQRRDLFSTLSYRMTEENQKAAVEAMRSTLPAEMYSASLADTARAVARNGSFEDIDAFLTRINPSAEERSTIVASSFSRKINDNTNGQPDPSKIEEARNWGLKQDAAATNQSTGEALGRLVGGGRDLVSLSAAATKYAEQNGGDQVLVPFLNNGATPTNASSLLPIVDRISDPAKREELRNKLQSMLPHQP